MKCEHCGAPADYMLRGELVLLSNRAKELAKTEPPQQPAILDLTCIECAKRHAAKIPSKVIQ
jgi:hypothetical protein